MEVMELRPNLMLAWLIVFRGMFSIWLVFKIIEMAQPLWGIFHQRRMEAMDKLIELEKAREAKVRSGNAESENETPQ